MGRFENAGRSSPLQMACALLCAISLCSCSGKTGGEQRESSLDDAAQRRQQQWQQILQNPGTAGVDYNPHLIIVSYQAGAGVPSGLVVTQPPPGERAAQQRNAMLRLDHSYEPLTDEIAARFGLKIESQVYNPKVHFASFRLPPTASDSFVLAGIRQDFSTAIEWATYDRITHPCFEPNDPEYLSSTDTSGTQWQLHKLHCSDAWDITFGSPDVRIAIIDTGVNLTHEELAGQVLDPQVEFPAASCDPGEGDNDVTDTYGHGSGCSGMAVAANNDGKTISGVAPGCRVIPIKVVDADNNFNMSAVIEGGYLAGALGAKIISMSYGSSEPYPLEEAMCDDLHGQGLLLCASAGNSDSTDPSYPGDYDSCLTVGATNVNDARISHPGWWGSQYGPGVEIAAPGEDYNSAYMGAPDAYQDFGGTSGASPQVAACAGLIWTLHPEWTNDQVRDALIETGMPTTGFLTNIPRVDAGNLVEQYANGFHFTPDNHLIQQGVLAVTPQVFGTGLESLSAYLDGQLIEQLNAAPWDLNVDTGSIYFGTAALRFDGVVDGQTRSTQANYVIDNTVPVSTLYDSCDTLNPEILPLDAKDLNPNALAALNKLDSTWSFSQLQDNGAGNWHIVTDGAYEGGSYFCGTADGSYDDFELDCLLLRKLDLTATANPSLTFMQHYNIEDGGTAFDRAYVLVSDDDGQNWEPATRRDGTLAMYTGYQPDWAKAEIDLSEYSGKLVHLALVFESDKSVTGENPDEAAGWWVDNIELSNGFNTLAHCDGASPAIDSVLGAAVGKATVSANLINPLNVVGVEYVLDCVPVGVIGPEDVVINGTPDSPVELNVPLVHNQIAQLRVTCLGLGGSTGQVLSGPVYIFNQLGDANLDGLVTQSDLDLIGRSHGLALGMPGYSPFIDADQDGTITEADAAAVGYGWGSTFP